MEFAFTKNGNKTTVRGFANQVQKAIEEGSPAAGYMTLGAVLAMNKLGHREVAIDFESDEDVGLQGLEVVAVENGRGEPTSIAFRFLDEEKKEEVANG